LYELTHGFPVDIVIKSMHEAVMARPGSSANEILTPNLYPGSVDQIGVPRACKTSAMQRRGSNSHPDSAKDVAILAEIFAWTDKLNP
jgi:hypothetical protein